MSQKPAKRKAGPHVRDAVTDGQLEVLMEEARAKQIKFEALKILAMFLGTGLLFICAVPIAYVLRGTETVVNVNIALTLSATLALSTVGCYGWGTRQRKRAELLSRRNDSLSKRITALKNQAKANGLDPDPRV